ncbi:hypothetical protein BH11BAC3_BH11BAC3_31600 [soil metagenome]
MKQRLLIFVVCTSLLTITQNVQAQHPQIIHSFSSNDFTENDYTTIREIMGNHKIIAARYQHQILLALSYFPELKDARIKFRVKQTRTPLASRPSWLSAFLPKKIRRYVITISDSSIKLLSPILLSKMDFNAQVGVLGHEISHVADFSGKHTFGLLRIAAGNFSSKFLDKFEFKTDSICVAHGLGYQLLSWSIFVRREFHNKNYDGADNIEEPMRRERYMNPATIKYRIKNLAIYQKKTILKSDLANPSDKTYTPPE